MPNKRVTMRKLREILRLRLQAGLSVRATSRSTKLSVGGVQKLLSRAEALSLTWPLPTEPEPVCQLLPVLRPLPALAGPATTHHAPVPQGRGEVLRGLRRQHRADSGRRHR